MQRFNHNIFPNTDKTKLKISLLEQFNKQHLDALLDNRSKLIELNQSIEIYSLDEIEDLVKSIRKDPNIKQDFNLLATNAANFACANLCGVLAHLCDEKTKNYLIGLALRKQDLKLLKTLKYALSQATIIFALKEATKLSFQKEGVEALCQVADNVTLAKFSNFLLDPLAERQLKIAMPFFDIGILQNIALYAADHNNYKLLSQALSQRKLNTAQKKEFFVQILNNNSSNIVGSICQHLPNQELINIILEQKTVQNNIEAVYLATLGAWQFNHAGITYKDLSLLSYCLLSKEDKIVDLLLTCNLDFNLIDNNNNSPIHYAVMMQNVKYTTKLLELGVTITTPSYSTIIINPVLHLATKLGNLTLIKLLLTYKADINAIDVDSGFSALHIAVLNKDLKITQFLLHNNANINQNSPQCGTPIILAPMSKEQYEKQGVDSLISTTKSNKILDLLLQNGANINAFQEERGIYQGTGSALHTAIDLRDFYSVRKLLLNGADLYNPLHYKMTPLEKIKQDSELLALYTSLMQKKSVY